MTWLPDFFIFWATRKNFQAVQEYSKRKWEFPAILSPPPSNFPAADALLLTEADLDGYGTAEYHCKDRRISSPRWPRSRSARLSSVCSLSGDEVLITDADLEGYLTDEETPNAIGVSSYGIIHSSSMISRLSCLFTSLKLSCSGPPVAGLLLEVRAC